MRFESLVLLGLAGAQQGAAVAPGPNLANAVYLTKAAKENGAVCLDGTTPRYWIQQSSSSVNASKWYFHFEGGVSICR